MDKRTEKNVELGVEYIENNFGERKAEEIIKGLMRLLKSNRFERMKFFLRYSDSEQKILQTALDMMNTGY